jgi:hypothetical protein
MQEKKNIWFAVFHVPPCTSCPDGDGHVTVFFEFDQVHTVLDLAREALGKRIGPGVTGATMVQVGPWGLSPQCRRTVHDSAL